MITFPTLPGNLVAGGRVGLPAPTNLVATNLGNDTFDASWDAIPDAAGYEYQLNNGVWVDAGNVTSLSGIAIP